MGEFNVIATQKLRGWMILFVLVGHTCNFALNKDGSFIIGNLSTWGNYAVCAFFFMSGYGLMHSYNKKGEAYLKGFLRKRLSKILIPLVLATILFLPVNYLIFGDTSSEILHGYLVGKPSLRFSWFCYSICIFYLAFWLIAKVTKKSHRIIISMIIFCAVYAVCLKAIDWKEHWYASSLSIPLGMCFSNYEVEIKKFLSKRLLLVAAFLPVLFAITIVSGTIGLSYYAISISIPILLYIATILCSNTTSTPAVFKVTNKCVNYLGGISYELYLCHGAFITILPICIERYHNTALCIIVSAIVLLLVTNLFKKFGDKVISLSI